MKNKILKLIIYLAFLLLIYYLFTHQAEIKINILNSLNLFITRVFPTLFPMFVITDSLISLNLPYYLNKYTSKYTKKLFNLDGSGTYVLIMSLLSGTPTNAIIIKELLAQNYLNNKNATNLLAFTIFNNPLFLYNMLRLSFSKNITLLIIINNYIANFILGFFLQKNNHSINPTIQINHISLANAIIKAISKSLATLTLILGTIVFFNLINIQTSNQTFNIILSSFLELTNALNNLSIININPNSKIILATAIISFSGLCIQMQIKSVITDTNINYKQFLKKRIWHLIISCLLILTTITIAQICCII